MEEENKEMVVSYETLFELLRREKERDELQKLHSSFFDDVASFIVEKKNSLDNDQTQLGGFNEQGKRELENLKRILSNLYEVREKKIVSMALDKSKTKSSIIDTSLFLKDESKLFDEIVMLLDRSREMILVNVSNGQLPKELDVKEEAKHSNQAEEKKESEEKENRTKMVRFVHSVPKFVGKELEEYGPFEEEDVASLPAEISNVLVKKGRAEELNEN